MKFDFRNALQVLPAQRLWAAGFASALFIIFAVLNFYSAQISSHLSELIVRAYRGELVSFLAVKVGLKGADVKLQPDEPLTTIHIETLRSPTEAPVIVGAINQHVGAYVHIQLRFRADDLDGYPNLFQTAASNSGIRMEISGAIAALILPDDSQPNGVRSLFLSTDLTAGSWHTLDVEAQNGVFVRGAMDDHLPVTYNSRALSFETSDIRVGVGFDRSRRFRGELSDISITKGNLASANDDLRNAIGSRIGRLLNILQFIVVAGLILVLLLAAREYRIWLVPTLKKATSLSEAEWKLFDIQPSLPEMKRWTSFAPVWFPALILLTPLLLYELIYFRSYYPITEGWFSVYGRMIRDGNVPYRDFDLLLPPLYPFQIALIQAMFGEQLIVLRIVGLFVTAGIGLALFHILRRVFDPAISAFSACVAAIYYQGGNAFIGYDFTQFLTLYVLLGTCFLLEHISAVDQRRLLWARGSLVSSGIFFACAALTKQSNGGITSGLMGVCALTVILRTSGSIAARSYIASLVIGVLIPVIPIAIWLDATGALWPFVKQVIWDAMAAKGGTDAIFLGWIRGYFGPQYWANSGLLIWRGLMILLVIAALNFICSAFLGMRLLHKQQESPTIGSAGANGFRLLFGDYRRRAFFVAAIGAAALVALILGLWIAPPKMPDAWISRENVVDSSLILFAVNLYLVGFLGSAYRVLFCRDSPLWFIVFSLGMSMMVGNGTSAGLSEISAFVALAVGLAFLLQWTVPTIVATPVSIVLALILSAVLIERKFEKPYSWWAVETTDLRLEQCAQVSGLLEGLCITPSNNAGINKLVEQIQVRSGRADPILVIPHVPIFYLLSNRLPFENAVVTWFDFVSQTWVRNLQDKLLEKQPRVLLVARLPEPVFAAHERLFNGGRPSAQRDLMQAIDQLEKDRSIQLVTEVTIDSMLFKLYERQFPSPEEQAPK